MGRVYRAVCEPDEVVVALKVLRRELSTDSSYVARFRHEARAAREVEHPHLVPVLDAGESEGRHYLATSYVSGGSLESRLERGERLESAEVVRVVLEIGRGLDALHAAGLVHRDVKPSNILLDEHGTATLTDFGLARGPAYTVLTQPGMVMGTIDYLAPELVRGESATPASDLYALGCVAFECLAGSPPFWSTSMFETVTAHVERPPSNPVSERPDCPAELGAAVLYALEKDPSGRPATGHAFALLLRVAARET